MRMGAWARAPAMRNSQAALRRRGSGSLFVFVVAKNNELAIALMVPIDNK